MKKKYMVWTDTCQGDYGHKYLMGIQLDDGAFAYNVKANLPFVSPYVCLIKEELYSHMPGIEADPVIVKGYLPPFEVDDDIMEDICATKLENGEPEELPGYLVSKYPAETNTKLFLVKNDPQETYFVKRHEGWVHPTEQFRHVVNEYIRANPNEYWSYIRWIEI